ncbi:MAG: hypothetical protein DI530_08475 [Sphingomonas sp.]|nr:MAG: hypothetical protein DI530_08475 [Sphingomonas sp.]
MLRILSILFSLLILVGAFHGSPPTCDSPHHSARVELSAHTHADATDGGDHAASHGEAHGHVHPAADIVRQTVMQERADVEQILCAAVSRSLSCWRGRVPLEPPSGSSRA